MIDASFFTGNVIAPASLTSALIRQRMPRSRLVVVSETWSLSASIRTLRWAPTLALALQLVAYGLGGFASYLRQVSSVTAVDDLTLEIRTSAPHAGLPYDLTAAMIVPRRAVEAPAEAFNSGALAIGTGPYRLANYRHGDRTEFTRNENYWAGPQPWAVYHHAFRYSEAEFGLSPAILLRDSDNVEPGVRSVLTFRAALQDAQLSCLVVEPGMHHGSLESLLDEANLRTVEADVMGIELAVQPGSFAALIDGVMQAIQSCAGARHE
jgi:hypothetical protein